METVAFLIIVAGFGLALALPLIIFGIFLHRVRILKRSWKPILLKVVCAVVVWACASFGVLFLDFTFVYAHAHTPHVDVRPILTLFVMTIVYSLIGWGLCYWVGRTRDAADYHLGIT